ncbi:MAG: ABC-F family ATP-binding cassette domain-containing protein [Mycoplasmoidaceae bacterium]|nr:MAG: ABC-F family ATP-binding cassette domain-containing protein [Mycoplasmoidaceae bacterium]
MAVLDVTGLNYSIKNKVLYENASFSLNRDDHMGIVGQNGTGKTTLLNIVINKIEVDTGDIVWQKGVKIGYLDQHAEIAKNMTIIEYLRLAFDHLFEVERELNKVYEEMGNGVSDELANKAEELSNKLTYSGFYDIDSTINKIAAGLGVQKIGMNSMLSDISGGQRAKVILAKLLLESPDVFLMDEPTNFLDKEQVEWLANYLKEFQGAYIIISHDFDFLNKVTNCIINIEFQQVKKYTGNFQQFIKLKEEHAKNLQTQFEKQQKEIEHLQSFINRFGAGTRASMAQSRQKQLDKMEIIPPAKSVEKPTFKLVSEPTMRGVCLKVDKLCVGYTKQLLPPISFDMKADDKIVISGFNGIGKSTLIKTLIGQIPSLGGEFKWEKAIKFGYFEQDLNWSNPKLTPFDIIKEHYPKWEDVKVRSALAQCAIKGKVAMQPIGTLSGGEQVKVRICILQHTPCNMLILDEPTNHIDVDSKEVLKEQLIKWTGGIILITHEHTFYDGWISEDKVIKINKK